MPSFFNAGFTQALNNARNGGLTPSSVINSAAGQNSGNLLSSLNTSQSRRASQNIEILGPPGEVLLNQNILNRSPLSGSPLAPRLSISPTGGGTTPLGPDESYVDDVTVIGERGNQLDMRVSLRAMPGRADAVYGEQSDENILSILHKTGGLIFPYTPVISVEQSVDYKSLDLVHTNNDIYTYTRTPSISLSVTGKFTIQNQREGLYALAVLHFLRTVSKMHFGENDVNAGLPPPILLFRGYGKYMFNDLKVVLKSHSYTLEDTVDYVDVFSPDGTKVRLPSLFSVSMSLGYQQTPSKMKSFDLNEFRTGALMRGERGWI